MLALDFQGFNGLLSDNWIAHDQNLLIFNSNIRRNGGILEESSRHNSAISVYLRFVAFHSRFTTGLAHTVSE